MIKSLRWRILLWHSLTLLLVVVSFGALLYSRLYSARFREVDMELEGAAHAISVVLNSLPPHELTWDRPLGSPIRENDRPFSPGNNFRGPPPRFGEFRQPPPRDVGDDGPLGPNGERLPHLPPPERERQQVLRLEQNLVLPEAFERRYSTRPGARPYFVVWRKAGDVLKASPHAPAVEPPAPEWFSSSRPNLIQRGDGNREFYLQGPSGSRIVVARSVNAELAELRQWLVWISLIGLTLVGLGVASGWWISYGVLRSLRAMSDSASQISEHNLSQRLDQTGVDQELGLLAGTLNSTFDRLSAAFRRQRQFTDDASHELRTPLTIILGNLSLALSAEKMTDAVRDSLKAATRASRRMKALTEHLLMLARADAGVLKMEQDLFDLSDTVHECVELLQTVANDKHVQLRLESQPSEMTGDQRLIAQVAINLIANAIQYSRPDGEILVRVVPHRDAVVLSVSDNGIGIPTELHEHIFERFFRADESRARHAGGNGLGLAITKTIVDAHLGEIDFHSQPDQGTEFVVHFPRKTAPPTATHLPTIEANANKIGV